jgi:hypothetical protein
MARVYLAFQHNTAPANAGNYFNDIRQDNATTKTLLDESAGATGWTGAYTYTEFENKWGSYAFTGRPIPTGDNSWADDSAVVNSGHFVDWTDVGDGYKVSTGQPNALFDVVVAIFRNDNRTTEFAVNGSLSKESTGDPNVPVKFLSVAADDSGDILIAYAYGTGDAGSAYIDAAYIEPAAQSPTVTTTDTLQPGESFTLTATNYASAPVSPVTLTDSAGSTITVAVTISGSGPYTAVGTMPTLAEAVTAGTSLLFGDVTIELTT